MDLSVIIPCYNEATVLETSLGRLVGTLAEMAGSSELILVDDCSTDGTRSSIARWVARHQGPPDVQVILHSSNQGRGGAVLTGASVARGRFAGFLDIDLEVDCRYLPEAVRALEDGADLVLGARRYAGGDARPSRVVLSRAYRRISRGVLGHPVEDSECGFKFFRLNRIAPVLRQTRERGWFWDTELVYRAWEEGLTIRELPVEFVRRPEKPSTVRPLRDSLDYLLRLARFRRALSLERAVRRRGRV